ncbi:dihydroorotate dehydrogenase electron transfer subunit [Mesobacillus jeotgali]|jgi:dihydroorotate dehydrogenase electron transfer subunit|uniref:Dihydroorotate dehydrogenase B (NAD(+)), electron transfer subunit n=1 Tax=Mesobacillus jeotgali TaxID=129985 RepID=A0ABY9VKD6_9BACI|nr:dihydroorotate dehydrogenase electron transfer subunit [Mesobacillus jeotgali]WNF24417.1 dihydroorotate dehydrogenase electron transfer subunit [Mesobacillus jeotgali]
MIRQENCKIVSNKQIAKNIFEMVLVGELSAEMKQAGQFVHVKVADGFDPLLRRPISIASINEGSFTIVYRRQGKGTSLLAGKSTGMTVDVLGPLGNGFPVDEAKPGQTAILVGGGVGVPPMYELAKQLARKGANVMTIIGFQSAHDVFYEKELAEFGEVYVATVDGSYGKKGFVTDVLDGLALEADFVFACGPTPMLRAIENRNDARKTYLSLEERMGCGIGACFACVCHTKEDPQGYTYKKVCSDGPVFQAGEVVI